MLGTTIEQNGDGFWKISTCQWDGRYTLMVPSDNVAFIDDMLGEYDMKRDSVEINHRAPQWSHNAVWNRKYMNQSQDTHCGNCGLTPSRHWAQIISVL